MAPLFGLLYTVLFFTYMVTGLFIVYHLYKYSLTPGTRILGAGIFSFVLIILLFTNAMIFFSLPFDMLIPDNYSF